MSRIKVGNKLYFTVDSINTMSWLTRKDARENRTSNGVLIEHILTPAQRRGLETIVEEVYEGTN